ncbi:alpha-galactosidase [Dyella sp. 7MK23]|uniref:Alpha-galactosidase n=2 Tax=Dyella acidiphila TaxID=2775866 RepID=A0ABR9GDC1_9GAMM|nr:alpha-galactosidase [Dyella acidiphila]
MAPRALAQTLKLLLSRGALACGLLGVATGAVAQVNGVAQKPYLGWSSFSQQTLDASFLTQANVTAQSDALASSGLQAHGFNYINMDSGWHGGFDANGRPIPDPSLFPDIKALIDHIHKNGQKAGIYWIPGVEEPAVTANSPILGTPYHIQDILAVPYTAGNAFGSPGTSPYHYKIDFSKPGAQAYIDSVVALFASWGVDFIKLDAVTPGSYNDNLNIDNRPDVAAWSKAIANSGRPIWLTISWEIDQDYLGVWQQFSNARRIDDDVECEGRCATLTDWPRIYKRFRDLPGWENAVGPALGWNDMDSLDIGDGKLDGLSHAEKRSAITLWAMANAPIYLGGDLTKLDEFGKQLATADEVLAVDQSGKPARQVLGGDLPVWLADLGDGDYYVALFNMNATPAEVTLPWREIGLDGVHQVRDLWTRLDLGSSPGSFSTVLDGHGVRLLKISTRVGHAPQTPSTSYAATAATLAGSASIADCPDCSDGKKVGGLGLGIGNTVTFQNVYARRAGVYLMQVDSMTFALRSYLYTVNGGPYQTLNAGGGSFLIPSSTTLPVCLQAGYNSIQFGNPTSYAPDLDRIVISGQGDAVLPQATTYEAEQATLGGTVTAGFSNYASGLSKAGNVGNGAANTVTFSNVTVPKAGTYQLEIDYATSGTRTLVVTVNNAAPISLSLDGSTFDDPRPALLRVQLKAGTNTIQLGNPSDYAPDLDRIVVAPVLAADAGAGVSTRMCPR